MGGVACRLGELRGCGCGCVWYAAAGVPLQIEHIHPRSRGGSDGVANLTLCCE
ncbi:MAG: HNH endonuclease, partial [Alphaproteobacteria bacterium]|nr:HNH endonuclease [Alphaproteobacteria bacterium]